MAGNDWINSYLEAILDAGGAAGEISAAAGGGGDGAAATGEKRDKSSLMLRERGRFSPARYFVEEVISGFDETDLYKTWVRTAAMRSPQERNTRLENMSWRIWNLARKKKQVYACSGESTDEPLLLLSTPSSQKKQTLVVLGFPSLI
jgi:sucrose-phosphate synthase